MSLASALFSCFCRRKLPKNLLAGEWGEKQAEIHLVKKGLKILARRYRTGNREELDLIAREGDVLVFVEVKTRRSEVFGRPVQSVNSRKKKLLCRAAARYLVKLRNPRVYYRFDVVEVIGSPEDGVKSIRHIPNAFCMDPKYSI